MVKQVALWRQRLDELVDASGARVISRRTSANWAESSVLQASYDAIVRTEPAPRNGFGFGPPSQHQLVDIVAVRPGWVSAEDDIENAEDATCAATPLCGEKPCIVPDPGVEHTLFSLRHLLTSSMAAARKGSAAAVSLPQEDGAILNELMSMHKGKVPVSALGISAKLLFSPSHQGEPARTGRRLRPV